MHSPRRGVGIKQQGGTGEQKREVFRTMLTEALNIASNEVEDTRLGQTSSGLLQQAQGLNSDIIPHVREVAVLLLAAEPGLTLSIVTSEFAKTLRMAEDHYEIVAGRITASDADGNLARDVAIFAEKYRQSFYPGKHTEGRIKER